MSVKHLPTGSIVISPLIGEIAEIYSVINGQATCVKQTSLARAVEEARALRQIAGAWVAWKTSDGEIVRYC
ncbi:MAG TPA: hypothetical protein PK402_12260 [Tepidisphaeraceae bacterium]|nr:hypothetical protein [Tepidisphaeraceae bacterium]